MKGDEFAIGYEQGHGRRVFDYDSGKTIIRADAEEVAIAHSRASLDEFVAHIVSEAKGVVHILPIAPANDKSFAVFLLPFEQLRLHAPPGIEMDVFNPADIVNVIHQNPATEWLAVDIAYEVPFIV